MKSICAVEGVTAYGVKEGKYGLTLIRAEGSAAGVFTENLVKAAPVTLMQERIRKGQLEAVIVNSGCANAYTGKRGYGDAVAMGDIASQVMGIDASGIGVGSTGVIGRYLDLPLIRKQCEAIAPKLTRSVEAEELAAKGINTQEELADLAADDLVEMTGIDIERANQIIIKAREPWFV